MRALIALTLFSVLCAGALAREIEGVDIPESVTLPGTQAPLTLNGAGVRKRFFVKVYIGALYLPSPATSAQAIIDSTSAKSVRMHFLYKEVDAEKLTGAWTEGVRNNHSEDEYQALHERLRKFNGYFRTVRRGETIQIDLLENGDTFVSVNGEVQGAVAGADFQRALLKVWLGERPADDDLKRAMLGATEES